MIPFKKLNNSMEVLGYTLDMDLDQPVENILEMETSATWPINISTTTALNSPIAKSLSKKSATV